MDQIHMIHAEKLSHNNFQFCPLFMMVAGVRARAQPIAKLGKMENYFGKACLRGTSGFDPSIKFILLTTLRQLGGRACEREVRSAFTQVLWSFNKAVFKQFSFQCLAARKVINACRNYEKKFPRKQVKFPRTPEKGENGPCVRSV